MPDEVQPPAGTLALGAHARVGQPDRWHQIAAGELGQHPGVDPVGLAGQRREALYLLRVGDLDLPARQLEPVVHESRAVHRLDRRADRLAMTLESSRQAEQTICVWRRRADVDRRALIVEQMEVETLATEIQTGVQHRTRAPLDTPSRQAGACHWSRPSFMALLTIVLEAVPFASDCHGLRPLGSMKAPRLVAYVGYDARNWTISVGWSVRQGDAGARKNARWSDRVATTAVTMQRRLSASWAEAPPRSPQGSSHHPGSASSLRCGSGREDARTVERSYSIRARICAAS
jgi:hypothetical protein